MRKIGRKWGRAEREVDSGGGLYAGCSCKLGQRIGGSGGGPKWLVGELVPRP